MKLKSVQITNFKCIEDSTKFDVDQVTCLVGKNEAGKSAILEAIYKLHPLETDKAEFGDLDYPRRHMSEYREHSAKKPANVLTTIWDLEEDDLEAVEEIVGPEVLKNKVITITKGYSNETYYPDIEIDEERIVEALLNEGPLNKTEVEKLKGPTTVAEIKVALEKLGKPSQNQQALLSEIATKFPKSPMQTVINTLHARLPTFVYFADYQRMAGRVAMNELLDDTGKRFKPQKELSSEHRIFLALLALAKSSAKDIMESGTLDDLQVELEAIQNRLTDEIFNYWTQNRNLSVQFSYDMAREDDPAPYDEGYIFSTRIFNSRHRAAVNFDDRSTGFVWFFSFLVWFSQAKRNFGERLIILLDEPGLALHGKAQRDLLRYFNEKLRPNYQLIYSTHSPFMIDMQNIFAVRTVEDRIEKKFVDEELVETILGTKVGRNVLSRDRDAVMPLQGLVGFDMAQTCFVGPYVLVVEGPTEAAYLNWFSRHLVRLDREALDVRWAVCPAESGSKISSFVTLFSGRGLKIAALMDYHDPQKKAFKQLEESRLLADGCLLKTTDIVDQDDADIEDLLGRELYAHLVHKALQVQPQNFLPATRPGDANIRIAKEVEDYARTLPPGTPEYGHYKPVEYLFTLVDDEIDALPGIAFALDNFEKLFKKLNALIPE